MILEIHVHSSKHSPCSKADAAAMIRQARKKGAQGIIITEHHYQWTREELDIARKESEVDGSFIILSGQEVKTDIGHVLVYGAYSTIGEPMALGELKSRFPGAALVWAHPLRGGKVPSREEFMNPLLDAVEIFNINHTPGENYLGLNLWHEYKFTAVAGTDAHEEKDAALFSTQLIHPAASIGEFAEELRRGRCMPFVKEIPRSGSNLVLTEIIMGTKGADEARNRLITKQFHDEKKWRDAKKALEIRERLYNSGFASGKYRVPRTLEVNDGARLVIEEGQRGGNLFDTLAYVAPVIGLEYFRLSAEWLAEMHGVKIPALPHIESAVSHEEKRFDSYLKAFTSTKSPYSDEAAKYISFVRGGERKIFSAAPGIFTGCHGDYHPKNIIIGQDRARDISTLFISVIDFDSFIFMPPEFDAGYFISQFLYQFNAMPYALKEYTGDYFLNIYSDSAAASGRPKPDRDRVMLFRLRANMSIAAFLIKVGKGESKDMEFLMNESRSLYSALR
ncbi:MAG: phosphotransferase [Candidatus Omnitrophota bacterium]